MLVSKKELRHYMIDNQLLVICYLFSYHKLNDKAGTTFYGINLHYYQFRNLFLL